MRILYLSTFIISALITTQGYGLERKPLLEAFYNCGFEANRALLSGPGRPNLDGVNLVMTWCMQKEGYSLDNNKEIMIGNMKVSCKPESIVKLVPDWSLIGNPSCYRKNEL